MGEIMGNIKDSGNEPDPKSNNESTDWKEVEYKECSEDWRHRDRLIWATLPVAATVGAVIIGVAYGQSLDDKPGVRFGILLIGVFLTLVMLISLIRHRMYQEGSDEQMRSLYIPPNIKDCDRSPRIHIPCDFKLQGIICEKFDAKLTSWSRARRNSGFKWMLRGTLVVTAVLVILATITFGQLIFLILKLATITFGQLIILILKLILN
jgi:hypothetical protein